MTPPPLYSSVGVNEGNNGSEISPGSSAESYPVFALNGSWENLRKSLQPGFQPGPARFVIRLANAINGLLHSFDVVRLQTYVLRDTVLPSLMRSNAETGKSYCKQSSQHEYLNVLLDQGQGSPAARSCGATSPAFVIPNRDSSYYARGSTRLGREYTPANRWIKTRDGLSESEWKEAIKMIGQVANVRAMPGRSQDGSSAGIALR
ncbi:hypothetical protein ANN_17411 [Periplaneta americana]|uniref:Uncharacterized protein n=1 Tax=Periplaneta americana TaxID=6978 RepID=A0ABQ8SSV9_PERAM|nr:hypothetical protein ANN_17411 [Periplaneta americana]